MSGTSPHAAPTAPAPPGPVATPRARPWIWILPALLTLAVTSVQADRAELWRDELATWSIATRPVGTLLRTVGTIDATSGAYYLVMHGWIAVAGDSVIALRLPSILCMAGAAALTALLGAQLFGARVGLLAGLLFALVPATSRYAQEARAYALTTLLAVLATVLLVGAVRDPRWRRWAGYALVVTALGLTHLVALSLLPAHAVAVWLAWRADRNRRYRRWLVALVPAALVLVPLAVLARGQQSRQLDWVDPPGLGDLSALPGALAQSGPVGGLLLGLAVLGLAGRGRPAALPALSVGLPAVLLFAAGLVTPLWVPRYLIFTLPFLCLLAGAALAPLRPAYALVLLVAAAGLGAPDQAGLRRTHEWPRTAPVGYGAAARVVAAHQRPGDAIVYSPRSGWWFLDLAMAYHLRDGQPRDVLLIRDQHDRHDLWATECDQPERCLAGVDRVWLLVTGEWTDPLAALPTPSTRALRDGFTADQVWQVPGLTVALLTR